MQELPSSNVDHQSRRLSWRIAFAILLWLSIISTLYSWQSSHLQSDTIELATREAITNFNREQALHTWASLHGGVYVPTDDKTPPSPWLSHIPERDITTPSGRELTLMNSSYMLRQLMQEYSRQFGVQRHLISSTPLNPANATDEWEGRAFKAIEAGAKEVIEVVEIGGKPHLRLLRPMMTEERCLKCHTTPDNQAGHIRGGISIVVDMTPYLKRQQEELKNRKFVLFTICIAGLIGLLTGWYRGFIRIREQRQSRQELRESQDKFHSISDAAQDAVVAIDENGAIRYWNSSAERIFGYSCEEAMGENLHQLIVPERYYQAHIDGWRHYAGTGEGPIIGKTHEVSALNRKGEEFPVEISISSLQIHGKWQAVGVIRDIRERKQDEADISDISRKIEQAHREWIDAFDSIQDPIFLHDKNGAVMRANHAYAKQAGMAIEELIGRPYWECFPKGEGPMQSCTLTDDTDDTNELDEEITLESGDIFLSRAFAIRDEDGIYRYSIHIMENITSERQAAQSLQESENRFRKLFVKAPLAYQSLDREGCLIEVNQKWEELLGYPQDEVIGQPFSNLLSDSDKEIFQQRLSAIHEAKENPAIQLTVCRKDGEPLLLSIEGRISYNTHGEIDRSHYILSDITEQKRAEEVLDRERERAQSYLDIAHVIMVILNNKGEITLINRQGCKVLGYQEQELMGRNWFKVCIPRHLQEHMQLIFEQLMQGDTEFLEHYENAVITHSGEERLIAWNNAVLRDKSGEINGLLASGEDITERKESEIALRNLNQMLRTSQACNEALVRATEEPTLIQHICSILANHADFSLVWVGLTDPAAKNGTSVYSSDSCESLDLFNTNWHDEEGPCPAKEAMGTGEIQVIHANDDDPVYQAYRNKISSIGCFSLAALPLQNKGKSLGVMMVYSYKPDVFDQQQIDLLEELSNDLAYGITSLRLNVDREQMGERLEHNLLQTVEAIARTLEIRDPYTAGHQRRVTELSVAIAREMRLDKHQIEGIRFGATIHDIGKIHIPAEILNRPGSLTDMEFGIIKSHAEVGNDIVKGIDFPWPVADIVYQHHERLDGSGYPQGLKGDEISLEAKILAVADVVEAMSSHRPYRPGLGIEAALDELKKNRGTYYDPDITDVCIKLFDDKLFTFSDSF